MLNAKSLVLLILIASILLNILLINKVVTKGNTSSPSIDRDEIHFAFSDISNNPKELLLQALNKATRTLDIAIYNIQDQEIAQAVLHANHRGVNVRILTDASKAKNRKQAALLDNFSHNNIEVKINPSRKMHLKTAIIDEQLIVTGSYNFTEASANENIEQLITIANDELAKQWTEVFDNLWNQRAFEHWEYVMTVKGDSH